MFTSHNLVFSKRNAVALATILVFICSFHFHLSFRKRKTSIAVVAQSYSSIGCWFFSPSQSIHLSIPAGKKRLALSVGADDLTTTIVDTGSIGESNNEGEDEENGHDCEGEDPLERDDDGEELGDTKS